VRIVALDTSGAEGSVALLEGQGEGRDGNVRVVAEALSRVSNAHGESLLPLLERILAEAGWHKGAIDRWAVGRGPGSFTGIRVALATVRGITLATGAEARGVTSFEAVRFGVAQETACILPGLPGEVFLQIGAGEPVSVTVDVCRELLVAHPGLRAIGAGCASLGLPTPDAPHDLPRAAQVGRVALQPGFQGELTPLYVSAPRISVPKAPR